MQYGKLAASGGLVALDVELVPVLLVLRLVLLPLLVRGFSFRTCLVTLSQHFTVREKPRWARTSLWRSGLQRSPCLPPTPRLRSLQFRSYAFGVSFLVADEVQRVFGGSYGNRRRRSPFLASRGTKKSPAVTSGAWCGLVLLNYALVAEM